MKRWLIPLMFALCACTSGQKNVRGLASDSSSAGRFTLERVKLNNLPVEQRVGYQLENPDVPFLGCVLYLEGLGDSMLNHQPTFSALTNSGFRVLAFDYLGQGGSDGDMDATRLDSQLVVHVDPTFVAMPDDRYEIGGQAKRVWEKYTDFKDPVFHRDCAKSRRMILGWSTGGLAAYKLAHEEWADAVALIAPGIVTNKCIGEAAGSVFNCVQKLWNGQVITTRTLTRNPFNREPDPHVDPIKPDSPSKVLFFAANLTVTSLQSRRWQINPHVSGIVFLSGEDDTYVDNRKSESILVKRAPHFKIVPYEKGSLHELDNEIQPIAEDLRARTVEFFRNISSPTE